MMSERPERSAVNDFADALAVAAARHRQRRVITPANDKQVVYDGRPCLNFCSNDYLGLARDKRIVEALTSAAEQYGVGATASPLVCGYTDMHQQLEQALATFTGYERVLLFNNGYAANLGAMTALAGKGTGVHIDRLVHASLIDGVNLSRTRFRRYAHNDVAALSRQLDDDQHERRLVATEGIFSMEGDSAPLETISRLCHQRQALLYLDDAHAFGVIGDNGRGSLSAQQLSTRDVPVMMATLGKAFGVSGAFVAGPRDLIDGLVQHARSLIYSTAMPPALAAAGLQALQIVSDEQWRRDRLQALIAYWRQQATENGLPLQSSASAIQPLLIGDDARTVALSNALLEQGLLISAIRPPTVPAGSARLRITLTGAHDEADIDRLVRALVSLNVNASAVSTGT